jgi:hypothetical protein
MSSFGVLNLGMETGDGNIDEVGDSVSLQSLHIERIAIST